MYATQTIQNQFGQSWMKNLVLYVVDHFAEEITLDDLSTASGMTKFHLCRTFQKKYGVTPMKWLWKLRTILAGELLKQSQRWNLTDIAFTCGFSSSAHFTRSFRSVHAVTPTKFRTANKEAVEASAETCLYTLAGKCLGQAMVAAVSA